MDPSAPETCGLAPEDTGRQKKSSLLPPLAPDIKPPPWRLQEPRGPRQEKEHYLCIIIINAPAPPAAPRWSPGLTSSDVEDQGGVALMEAS